MFFNKHNYKPLKNETVLKLLLRHNEKISYACESGVCQSCILQCLDGDVDEVAQTGLKSTDIAQGHFLACQQNADKISSACHIDEKGIFSSAQLVEKHLYTPDICRLRFVPSTTLYYHAGQFINLRNSQGVVRSYSLASVPNEDIFLEIHVRRKHNGKMSNWLIDSINIGEYIEFQGAIGNCFYTGKNPAVPLTMIGSGTGAAPLIGIARDAIHSNHQGEIHFYHGAKDKESLYLHQELLALQNQVDNFFYHPCIGSSPAEKDDSFSYGLSHEIALKELKNTDGILYLCGNPEMVSTTKKRAFLAGFSLSNIYSDPFEYQNLRTVPR